MAREGRYEEALSAANECLRRDGEERTVWTTALDAGEALKTLAARDGDDPRRIRVRFDANFSVEPNRSRGGFESPQIPDSAAMA